MFRFVGACTLGDSPFTMTADFNSNTAKIAATDLENIGSTENSAMFYATNGMAVNQSNSSFFNLQELLEKLV